MKRKAVRGVIIAGALTLVGACGSSSSNGNNTGDGGGGGAGGGGGSGGQGHITHVFLILMENHNWSDVYKSSSAPYINSLLSTASYCDNYYENPKQVHPSEPNYIWLEAGDNLGIADDNLPLFNHQSTTQHLVTALKAAGVSWRSYQEDIDGSDCPVSNVNLYAPKHDPMVFFDDIAGNPPSSAGTSDCKANVRPYTELAGDLASGLVAQYNFITPNLCDDMHNSTGCATGDSVKNGDTWLSANVPAILGSQVFKSGGALFITWDESENGEFPIGMIVLSPFAKGGGYVSHTRYYHSSMLRTVQEIFGITPLIRDAANQANLGDLFNQFP